jgi:hypothetical protein
MSVQKKSLASHESSKKTSKPAKSASPKAGIPKGEKQANLARR